MELVGVDLSIYGTTETIVKALRCQRTWKVPNSHDQEIPGKEVSKMAKILKQGGMT